MPLPVKPDKTPATILWLFAAEIIVVGILAAVKIYLDDLGMGGIILVLPLLAAYCFVLSAFFAIPILSISVLKNRGNQRTIVTIAVAIAALANTLAAIWFIYGIIQLLVTMDTSPIE